eukprot:CAMPEP_0184497658 /NCGR_PEP_ID=MMETSP0113_2-20130426/37150_1 /TAXON_ID=91329 /ORGANISM="Norrisiella sphaerica, Strain BC52" /LENGTH=285 /DNA_ID=CAMNT_0026884869 /DNA_START=470 /DNA_END=1327 /DNA_ORIENTATION=+
MTIVFLKFNYSALEYAGMATVLLGVGVAFGLRLKAKDVSVLGSTLLFCSCIPTAGLNILIEKEISTLQQQPETYMPINADETKQSCPSSLPNASRSDKMQQGPFLRIFQEILLIIAWENGIGLVLNVPLSMLVEMIQGQPVLALWTEDTPAGWRCLFGGTPQSRCRWAYLYTLMFAPLGVVFIVMQLFVTVYAGSTLMFLVIALSLPLQNFFLASDFIMGSNAGTFYRTDFYGLVVIIVGLLAFILGQRLSFRQKITHIEETTATEEGKLACICEGANDKSFDVQ